METRCGLSIKKGEESMHDPRVRRIVARETKDSKFLQPNLYQEWELVDAANRILTLHTKKKKGSCSWEEIVLREFIIKTRAEVSIYDGLRIFPRY